MELGIRNAERKKEDRVLNGELLEWGIGNAECGKKEWGITGMRKELYGTGHKAQGIRIDKDAIRISTLNPEP